MEKKIKAGLASFGMSGQVFHGPLLDTHPGFEITRIFERRKSVSAQVYPDASLVRSFHDFLHDTAIDLVIINTPDDTHYEFTKEALLAGKHVVVEKPFVFDPSQGEELIALAKSKGLVLTVFQNRRWDGDFLTVRKVIESGLLGRLVEFEGHFDRYKNFIQPDTWKEDPSSGTGVLFNLGSHMIDQACVLFGKPESVSADIRVLRTGGKVDDYYDVDLYYPDKKVKVKSSYLVREEGPRYMIHGTSGSFLKWGLDPQEADLKDGVLPDIPSWGVEDEKWWGLLNTTHNGLHFKGRIETIPGNYMQFYNLLYACLVRGDENPVDPKTSLLGIKIIKAAFESNEGKKVVHI